MINVKKYSKMSMYKKMIFAFSFAIGTTILLLSFFLYELFKYNAILEVNRVSQEFLAQTSSISNIVQSQAINIGNQLSSDPEITKLMLSKKTNYNEEYQILLKIKDIEGIYPFINSICIYNGYTDRYSNNKGISIEDEEDLKENILSRSINTNFHFIPRRIHYPYSTTAKNYSHSVLTYIFSSVYGTGHPSAIVINIDESYLRNSLSNITKGNINDILVLDESGELLHNINEKDTFLKDYSSYQFYEKINNSEDDQGSFLDSYENKKVLITYVKSEQTKWLFVAIQEYDKLLAPTRNISKNLIYISALLLLIGFMASLILAKRINQPLKNLVANINNLTKYKNDNAAIPEVKNELYYIGETIEKTLKNAFDIEKTLNTSMPILENTYLVSLLNGKQHNITEATKQIISAREQLNGPYFCVLAILLEVDESCYTKESYYMLYNSACDLIDNVLSKTISCKVINSTDSFIYVLLQKESEINIPTEILKEINTSLKNSFDITVSISKGDQVDKIDKISESYASAKKRMSARFFTGINSIILTDYKHSGNKSNSTESDFTIIQSDLINALQYKKLSIVEQLSQELIDMLLNFYPEEAFIHMKNFILIYEERFNYILNSTRQANSSISIDTTQKFKSYLISNNNIIHKYYKDKKSNKHIKLVDDIKVYINKNYMDFNLSLQSVADNFNISPHSLSRIFSNISGTVFSDYVNITRLNIAKRMLAETNLKTKEICNAIGLLNYSYFFTLFKKYENITPVQYRKNKQSTKK